MLDQYFDGEYSSNSGAKNEAKSTFKEAADNLVTETKEIESMTVECLGFTPVKEEEFAALGVAKEGRALICKATCSLMVKRGNGGGETLEHRTHIWRGTEGEVKLVERWDAEDDDDEGW